MIPTTLYPVIVPALERNLTERETIMTFTQHVIRSNEAAAKAVVDAGILDVLVDVVSNDFEGWDSEAIAEGTRVLAALAEYHAILPLLNQSDIAYCWRYYIPGLRPLEIEELEVDGEQDLVIF